MSALNKSRVSKPVNDKLPILAALSGNAILTVAKFIGFLFSGSGAILSEAIHSFADTLNQVLLLIGFVRAHKKPDAEFQYGYGAERFVWALMSAVGIFFLGCGVTVYHGISQIINPQPLAEIPWALGILLVSFVLEFSVLLLALRSLMKSANGAPFFRYLREEAEPGVTAVLFEDAAASVGVMVALIGIGLAYITGNPVWDAVSSIFIGLLMGLTAVFLIARNHGALVGPSVPIEVHQAIEKIIRNNPAVEKIIDLRSRVIDPETYRIKADIRFDGRYLAKKLEKKLRTHYPKVHTYEQFKNFAVEYADEVIELLSDEIDDIEKDIQKDFPKAQFLDIEAD